MVRAGGGLGKGGVDLLYEVMVEVCIYLYLYIYRNNLYISLITASEHFHDFRVFFREFIWFFHTKKRKIE